MPTPPKRIPLPTSHGRPSREPHQAMPFGRLKASGASWAQARPAPTRERLAPAIPTNPPNPAYEKNKATAPATEARHATEDGAAAPPGRSMRAAIAAIRAKVAWKAIPVIVIATRSEERRVGKECRS